MFTILCFLLSHAVISQLILAVSGWLKLALDVAWSWIALSAVRGTLKPPGSYWVIVNRVMQVGNLYRHFKTLTNSSKPGTFRCEHNSSSGKVVLAFRCDPFSSKGTGRAFSRE